MTLKLDMAKAYDRVEWNFLKDMLQKLGFHAQWVDSIMMCIGSVKYMISVDGSDLSPLLPGRVPRQGDPLSLYLFILCVEVYQLIYKKRSLEI